MAESEAATLERCVFSEVGMMVVIMRGRERMGCHFYLVGYI